MLFRSLVRNPLSRSPLANPLAAGLVVMLLAAGVSVKAVAQEGGTGAMTQGSVELQMAGPLTFGPKGVLFVADPLAARIVALQTNDEAGTFSGDFAVEGLHDKVAGALGTTTDQVLINDMAVNPDSAVVYLSVSRGTGPDADAVIIKIDDSGELSQLDLSNISHASAAIPNPPAEDAKDRRGRPQRVLSVTDIAMIDDQIVVAGLSNEEFSSNLRSIPFPFDRIPEGTALEVYHGAHGRYETNAPVRTFTSILVDNEPHIVAAYTCTPLVRFPMEDLTQGDKIRGTTVAELGNWNSPIDMFVYEKDDASWILMANTARGMMKISMKDIDREEGITERINDGGTAGQAYETIDEWKSAVQLDRYGNDHALVLLQHEDGGMDLKAVRLP